jgi:hypothetical protein
MQARKAYPGLRHTVATLMLIQGVPAKVVQEMLGRSHVISGMGEGRPRTNSSGCSAELHTKPALGNLRRPNKARKARYLLAFLGWANRGSNPGPHGCEP